MSGNQCLRYCLAKLSIKAGVFLLGRKRKAGKGITCCRPCSFHIFICKAVPFKEKDKIAAAYKEALNAAFPGVGRGGNRRGRAGKPQLTEKERLIQKYNQLEQDIVTYENNIGFFAMSKNAEPLIKQMQDKIDASKAELAALAEQIKALKEAENN